MSNTPELQLEADVLVIGGGMAAGWAAISAARAGAQVILADKGYMGTSGVTAAGGPGHWWVPPAQREQVIEKRLQTSFNLADPRWMARIIDTTWNNLPSIGSHYDFGVTDDGFVHFAGLRGPEYMRALREIALEAGVRILDQSPALELLVHADQSVAGARGLQRLTGEDWSVRSGSVIVATGGCAFLSGLIGSRTNTGDGYLLAAEAGAELSGMEFSSMYTVSPAWTSTRTLVFAYARYFDGNGNDFNFPPFGGGEFTNQLARALQAGRVFCSLDQIPEDVRPLIPQVQPATELAFRRRGLDPYKDPFEVKLYAEGTIRGTGGLRITDDDCQTTIRGLYAAGDAATRELITGAVSGGGSPNSAFALSSGLWSGAAAASRARELGRRAEAPAQAVGGAGVRPQAEPQTVDLAELLQLIKNETLPFEKNLFRTGEGLTASLQVLDQVWRDLRLHAQATGLDRVKLREAAALIATARWSYRAALVREESRGLHQRIDRPALNPALNHRLLAGGLDQVWIRPDTTSEGIAA